MAPLMMVFAAYLGSVLRRFDLLAARFEAGRLHTRTKRPRLVATKNGACDETPRKPRLSRRFGWVIEVCGYYAAGYAANLRHMLANDTEMRALMASSKQAARILRPLCRMLMLEPGPDLPPSLFPPRPAKAPPAAPAPPNISQPSFASLQGPTLQSRTGGSREPGAARDARLGPWQDETSAAPRCRRADEPIPVAIRPNQP